MGDFDPQAVKQALSKAFEGWASPSPYARVPEPFIAVPPARLELPTPDKQNATLSVVQALPLNDRHPDYPALMLANHLLGNGGDSRLWNRVREKEGLSYTVYSTIQWNSIDENSAWHSAAIFAPQNRDKVEKAVLQELDKAVKEGFTQAELDAGRKGLLNFRRLARAQDARLAANWASNLFLDRTFADSARIDAALESLTLAQVNDALKRYIKPSQFVLGAAGDFKPAVDKKP